MLMENRQGSADIAALMNDLGARARAAAGPLSIATPDEKNAALEAMAEALTRNEVAILEANREDMTRGEEAGLSPALLDRLKLDPARIAGMAEGIRAIAALKDPIGDVIAAWERPNGLQIERVRTPLGVIGVIYESRPNVTADAGALCLKAGNAVILRGGSDSARSSAAIHACLVEGLEKAGLPADAIQRVPVTDRAAVGEMLKGLGGNVDVIVPRGGRSLVERVQSDARVPVFSHLEGICHLYLDRSAETGMAISIAVNAKMRRTGICGAAETLLVDRAAADRLLVPVLSALEEAGCAIRGDEEVCARFASATPATD
ncbi:MAG: glutamate-5-semialdehyde dehydrogenase, partial [Nitratireductor sp.]